jgi:hypothetical protein
MLLKKTRYPGIYERTQETGRVPYLARARVKGGGTESKSFSRFTDQLAWQEAHIAAEWCPDEV